MWILCVLFFSLWPSQFVFFFFFFFRFKKSVYSFMLHKK